MKLLAEMTILTINKFFNKIQNENLENSFLGRIKKLKKKDED